MQGIPLSAQFSYLPGRRRKKKSVSEALFCLCRGTNIYNSFGGVPEFQDTYHGFLYFLTFLVFLSGFFILLVQEKHRKTLYRFLLAKIKRMGSEQQG